MIHRLVRAWSDHVFAHRLVVVRDLVASRGPRIAHQIVVALVPKRCLLEVSNQIPTLSLGLRPSALWHLRLGSLHIVAIKLILSILIFQIIASKLTLTCKVLLCLRRTQIARQHELLHVCLLVHYRLKSDRYLVLCLQLDLALVCSRAILGLWGDLHVLLLVGARLVLKTIGVWPLKHLELVDLNHRLGLLMVQMPLQFTVHLLLQLNLFLLMCPHLPNFSKQFLGV